jgi:hypothetical protein
MESQSVRQLFCFVKSISEFAEMTLHHETSRIPPVHRIKAAELMITLRGFALYSGFCTR